jgi:hypothetical protein
MKTLKLLTFGYIAQDLALATFFCPFILGKDRMVGSGNC